MSSIKDKIKLSEHAFSEMMWPIIKDQMGGGRIVSVESVTDFDFFKQYLDAYGGIDSWHIDETRCLMRGLSTRMQQTKKIFHTITIRFRRPSGMPTEIDKRIRALQEPGNWLHPSLIVQGYFTPGYTEPKAVAIARMEDVIKVVRDGKRGTSYRDPGDWYVDSTSQKWGNNDNTEFAVIPLESLSRSGCKMFWKEM